MEWLPRAASSTYSLARLSRSFAAALFLSFLLALVLAPVSCLLRSIRLGNAQRAFHPEDGRTSLAHTRGSTWASLLWALGSFLFSWLRGIRYVLLASGVDMFWALSGSASDRLILWNELRLNFLHVYPPCLRASRSRLLSAHSLDRCLLLRS